MAVITAKGIANQMTWVVTFKRQKEWAVRLWIALQLIKLAMWVSWMNVEFEEV